MQPLRKQTTPHSRLRGGSALEMALLMPWYIFLFVGAYDWGFYAHALISTEAAARAAALWTSQNSTTASNQTMACTYAANELKISSNIPTSTNCQDGSGVVLIVSANLVNSGADGQPATSVTVKYQTIGLIPIPLVLNKQFWIQRTVQMRLRA